MLLVLTFLLFHNVCGENYELFYCAFAYEFIDRVQDNCKI